MHRSRLQLTNLRVCHEKTVLKSEYRGLSTVFEPQFPIDVPESSFDRGLRQEQLGGYLFVAETPGDTSEYLDIWPAQHRATARANYKILRTIPAPVDKRQLPDNLLRNCRAEDAPTGIDGPNRVYQILGRDVLQDVADGSGSRRLAEGLWIAFRAQDENPDVGAPLFYRTNRLDAAAIRQTGLHHDDIGG